MKRILVIIVVFSLLIALPLPARQAQEQKQEQEPVREEVKVVNVEVPVRVFYKGKPVDNLTKDDFKLFEGKKEQVITGFNIKRNKIKTQEIDLAVEERKSYPSRYFVLVFRITDYSPPLKKGVAHIFNDVLREQDELRIFINDQNIYFPALTDMKGCYAKVDRIIMEQSINARQRMQAYFKKLEQQVNKTKWKLLLKQLVLKDPKEPPINSQQRQTFLKNFLKRYLMIWKEYKDRYLIPEIDPYYYFARHLEGIKKEKWVINFYQMEMFPEISMTGEARRVIRRYISELRSSLVPEDKAFARILDRQLNEIDRELNVVDEFPAKDVSKIFYKVDATFHSIFMRSTKGLISDDYAYKRVSSDIENSLREITKTTGGTLVATNNLVKAMDTIGEKYNIYYLLTYAPENPDNPGEIKVKVSDKKYNVIYDNNIRADYIKEYLAKKASQAPTPTTSVQITNLEFNNKKLTFAFANFHMQKAADRILGRTEVRIRIKDSQGVTLFDSKKDLTLIKKSISISIPFNNLKKGKYDMIVDVKDLFTGKADTKFIQPTIR